MVLSKYFIDVRLLFAKFLSFPQKHLPLENLKNVAESVKRNLKYNLWNLHKSLNFRNLVEDFTAHSTQHTAHSTQHTAHSTHVVNTYTFYKFKKNTLSGILSGEVFLLFTNFLKP